LSSTPSLHDALPILIPGHSGGETEQLVRFGIQSSQSATGQETEVVGEVDCVDVDACGIRVVPERQVDQPATVGNVLNIEAEDPRSEEHTSELQSREK